MGDPDIGVSWLEPDLPRPFRLVFTDRRGGVSGGPYATLNLGFNTGDDPSDVTENRSLLSRSLGEPLEKWTLVRQVHSSIVVSVSADDVGAGSRSYASGLAEADAMITREPGALLCVLAADCVPVAIYGGQPPAVALIHSGWKGTYEEICGAALGGLWDLFGIRTEEVGACLGPGIRRCCYEVGKERARAFTGKFGSASVEGANLDLYHAIKVTLARKGVAEERILDTGLCTACDTDYFSHRRDGRTGRQAALLWITERK